MSTATEKGAPRGAQLLPTETRVRTIEHEGQPVDVPLQVVQRRDGGFAFYQRGTGPFFSNRETRRGHFRGVEGHHDGSKRTTKGRVRRPEPPFRGNVSARGVRWVG